MDENLTFSVVCCRYAEALFGLSRDRGLLVRVEEDLVFFSALLNDKDNDDLRRLVVSPVFSAGERERALKSVFGRCGVGGVILSFLCVLVRNGRLSHIRSIISRFRSLCAEHRGEMNVIVVSAFSFTEAQIARLKESIGTVFGKDVQISVKVDPALLGGFSARMGSRMIDLSVRTRLNALCLAMKEVVF
ncbi:MAG: F0F1 ATP synthase subunit delta [Alphaproteobacteria bacterium]|nr:F0F1 ATP synthase subunit delta [Alphaproteobacteria bacterium]